MNNSYHTLGQQNATQDTPVSSSLEGIRQRIEEITHNVGDLHGIADRACGQNVTAGDKGAAPKSVPNGMLDEIENALDQLVNLTNTAVVRLARIA